MELVEVSDFRIVFQVGVVHVGCGNHGHQSTRRAVTRLTHEFENRVKIGRVGTIQINNWLQNRRDILGVAHSHNVLGRVVIDQITNISTVLHTGTLGGFASLDPIDVSKKGVDFTIVSHSTHGLCEGPARTGISRKATVVNDELGRVVGVGQIFVELGENGGLNHTLVNNSAGTEGRNIDFMIIVPCKSSISKFDRETTTYKIKGSLETITRFVVIVETLRGLDKELPNARHSIAGHGSQNRWVDRDLAPSQKFKFVGNTDLLDAVLDLVSL
jgi:hypothetical protein